VELEVEFSGALQAKPEPVLVPGELHFPLAREALVEGLDLALEVELCVIDGLALDLPGLERIVDVVLVQGLVLELG